MTYASKGWFLKNILRPYLVFLISTQYKAMGKNYPKGWHDYNKKGVKVPGTPCIPMKVLIHGIFEASKVFATGKAPFNLLQFFNLQFNFRFA